MFSRAWGAIPPRAHAGSDPGTVILGHAGGWSQVFPGCSRSQWSPLTLGFPAELSCNFWAVSSLQETSPLSPVVYLCYCYRLKRYRCVCLGARAWLRQWVMTLKSITGSRSCPGCSSLLGVSPVGSSLWRMNYWNEVPEDTVRHLFILRCN